MQGAHEITAYWTDLSFNLTLMKRSELKYVKRCQNGLDWSVKCLSNSMCVFDFSETGFTSCFFVFIITEIHDEIFVQ